RLATGLLRTGCLLAPFCRFDSGQVMSEKTRRRNAMPSCAAGARRLAFAMAIGFAGCALAQQDYPNRPIRYILPYAPGGSTGFTARLVGQRLTEAWGQQVVIDYRAGANTVLGTEAAERSKPDGYTLVYIGSVLATNHVLLKTPYDATRDIAPIATIA